jgi:hypothetical protein
LAWTSRAGVVKRGEETPRIGLLRTRLDQGHEAGEPRSSPLELEITSQAARGSLLFDLVENGVAGSSKFRARFGPQ